MFGCGGLLICYGDQGTKRAVYVYVCMHSVRNVPCVQVNGLYISPEPVPLVVLLEALNGHPPPVSSSTV